VPVRAVELDSWCYQHEVLRPIAEIGYPEEVPPSGLMRWEPRVDAFDPAAPGHDPIEQLADRLGHPPLVSHTTSTRDGKVWTFVVAINTSAERRVMADRLYLAALGLEGSSAVYDWRHGAVERTDAIRTEAARDWGLWVCAPPGERADAGDLTKYVTVPSDLD
jgi:hypothetical protein